MWGLLCSYLLHNKRFDIFFPLIGWIILYYIDINIDYYIDIIRRFRLFVQIFTLKNDESVMWYCVLYCSV